MIATYRRGKIPQAQGRRPFDRQELVFHGTRSFAAAAASIPGVLVVFSDDQPLEPCDYCEVPLLQPPCLTLLHTDKNDGNCYNCFQCLQVAWK